MLFSEAIVKMEVVTNEIAYRYKGERMKVKKIGIVSLSSGIMGEDFVKHELDIGLKRLKEYGIEVEFLPNALKGMEFIKDNPGCRAED